MSWSRTCPGCIMGGSELDGAWMSLNYNDIVIKRLIRSLKYHFAQPITDILADFMIKSLRNELGKARLGLSDFADSKLFSLNKTKNAPPVLLDPSRALIIPVPLHPRRERWRGFNHARQLAGQVAGHFGMDLSDYLIRTRYTIPQAKLDRIARLHNPIGAFVWKGPDLSDRSIILVDDVFTTGATMNECAKVLKKCGAKEVWGLAAAG